MFGVIFVYAAALMQLKLFRMMSVLFKDVQFQSEDIFKATIGEICIVFFGEQMQLLLVDTSHKWAEWNMQV